MIGVDEQVGISRKFEPEQTARLAELGAFAVQRRWLDSKGWFTLNELIGTSNQV